MKISKARAFVPAGTSCNVDGDLMSLRWTGKTANVTLKAESYFPAASGHDKADGAPRAYLDPMRSLETFRQDLLNRVPAGRLRREEAERLLSTIPEHFPLPPYIAYLLRFGSYTTSGFLALTPEFRLQVVSPVYAATREVKGYETSYYAISSAGQNGQVRLSLGPESKPAQPLPFPIWPGYFRLLFWTAASSADHLATLLGAPDEVSLANATKQFEARPERFCESALRAGVACVTVPPNSGVNAEVQVFVNRKVVFVPIGAQLREAMGSLRNIDKPPPTLKVTRRFEQKQIAIQYDAASADILGLVLMPGDEITW